MGITHVRHSRLVLRIGMVAATVVVGAGCAHPVGVAHQTTVKASRAHADARPLVALLPLVRGGVERRVTPPIVQRDLLTSDVDTLHTTVGDYSDCSGASAIPSNQAALWTCVPGRLYFVGHNPGVFTPLMRMRVGDRLTYVDDDGTSHRYQVVRVESWGRADGFPPPASAQVVAQLQTCITADGWSDRIVDVIEV